MRLIVWDVWKLYATIQMIMNHDIIYSSINNSTCLRDVLYTEDEIFYISYSPFLEFTSTSILDVFNVAEETQ